ncbi:P22AR C-terminal domain-containing protein [Klebsiella oxytoca]|uniref:P22AR C-terminal domain-containing protein n=1 Tax=Klebsiella oxytoca TaxID=571 RepID=UPI0025944CE8|nr:P22AR C-terminal domain-containing protein [Klebsiella oxytoca]MDM4533369.1 P22AR C-terminal domain-containing protein [Klebsiella oxytoca]
MALSRRRNSEAPLAATFGASIENNREGNIDMNSVQNKELSFHNVTLVPAPVADGIWLTSADVAKALGYASSKSVSTIYSRNSDEFTSSMSMVIKMMTNGINNNLREKSVRVFSLRGCHLIAMFATTDKAKEFRRWVLDILDREVAHSPIAKQFTDDELSSLAWLWRASDIMLTACESVTPLLKVAEHRQAGHFHTIGQELPRTINKAREIIKRETAHIEFHPWKDDNWSRVLPHLRREMLQ